MSCHIYHSFDAEGYNQKNSLKNNNVKFHIGLRPLVNHFIAVFSGSSEKDGTVLPLSPSLMENFVQINI